MTGHYERPEEFVECTRLGYALRFPETHAFGTGAAVRLLREHGAPEWRAR